MNKLFLLLLLVLALGGSVLAQPGRPAAIENISTKPVIGVRNENDPTKIALSRLTDQLNALTGRVASLESENASLKTQDNSLKKQIADLSTAQVANYKLLDYSITQLNKKFTNQVGTYRISGFIGSSSLGTNKPVQLLMGVHE